MNFILNGAKIDHEVARSIRSFSISWYLHDFNTKKNLDYVGNIPDISNYDASEMSECDWREFL